MSKAPASAKSRILLTKVAIYVYSGKFAIAPEGKLLFDNLNSAESTAALLVSPTLTLSPLLFSLFLCNRFAEIIKHYDFIIAQRDAGEGRGHAFSLAKNLIFNYRLIASR